MDQAVTGRLPFNAETFNELVFKIALENPEPAELIVPNLDPGFAQILSRSMARDVAARFQSAKDFQTAVQDWMMRNMTPADFAMILGGGSLVATAQRGLPAVQLPAGMTGPSFGPPQPGLGTSQPGPLGASQPGMRTSQPGPLGASQPGMGMSQPGLGTSQPGLGASGPQLGASQAGLAVTAPAPKKSGALIAVALAGVLVLGGGAFGVYKFALAGPPAGAGPGETAKPAVTTAPTTPVQTATAAPTPVQTATAAPTTDSEPMVIEEPVATTGKPGKLTGKIPPKGSASAKPTTTPSTPPTGTGKTAPTGTGTGRKVEVTL
jgi:hypothetical protein